MHWWCGRVAAGGRRRGDAMRWMMMAVKRSYSGCYIAEYCFCWVCTTKPCNATAAPLPQHQCYVEVYLKSQPHMQHTAYVQVQMIVTNVQVFWPPKADGRCMQMSAADSLNILNHKLMRAEHHPRLWTQRVNKCDISRLLTLRYHVASRPKSRHSCHATTPSRSTASHPCCSMPSRRSCSE